MTVILKFIISPLHSMTYPNSLDMSANNRPHAVLATTFLWWTPHLARPPMTLAMEQCSENASRASLASYRMNLIFQKRKIVTYIQYSFLSTYRPVHKVKWVQLKGKTLLYKSLVLVTQIILLEIYCAIYYTNLHESFCQFISWTNWVNSGKFNDNCWILLIWKKFKTNS